MTLDSYYAELAKVRDSGKGDELREMLIKEREKILAGELSKTLMSTEDICSLSGDQFATLMSNEDLINQMRGKQIAQNQEDCKSNYPNKPVDFASGNSWLGSFFATLFGTNDQKKNELVRYGSEEGVYDNATNECVVVIKEYHCARVRWLNNSRCKEWDIDNPVVSEERIKMPEWNTPTLNSLCPQTGQSSTTSGGASVRN